MEHHAITEELGQTLPSSVLGLEGKQVGQGAGAGGRL